MLKLDILLKFVEDSIFVIISFTVTLHSRFVFKNSETDSTCAWLILRRVLLFIIKLAFASAARLFLYVFTICLISSSLGPNRAVINLYVYFQSASCEWSRDTLLRSVTVVCASMPRRWSSDFAYVVSNPNHLLIILKYREIVAVLEAKTIW